MPEAIKKEIMNDIQRMLGSTLVAIRAVVEIDNQASQQCKDTVDDLYASAMMFVAAKNEELNSVAS